ncbi:uncharacterized protein LOC119596057 isoform X2 [Penaeus monodon]|uniref:uncharacterized protein LOC119596057 isoform X2 n=1 Tax=Penaeus monodon TaxID=6687 RepID=UPI0018A74C25|nr:uncharacterized protein LOC119596057 isoform X2 [Penaeus monodon]
MLFKANNRKYFVASLEKDENESTQPTISVVTISKLWKQALQTMGNVLSDWTDGTSALDLDHVKALGEIIGTAGCVITNIPNTQVTLQFFPNSWVTVAADSLATIMAETDNVNFVMCLMETIASMTWTGSVAESSNTKPQNNHTWMSLATLPWMASEVSLLDLKPPNAKQYTSWASRLKWGNDSRVKAISISIIAMMPEDLAPKWRCHIMRAAINERDSFVMHEVAKWFPVMVHQLGGAGGQQLVGEVVGAVLHFH